MRLRLALVTAALIVTGCSSGGSGSDEETVPPAVSADDEPTVFVAEPVSNDVPMGLPAQTSDGAPSGADPAPVTPSDTLPIPPPANDPVPQPVSPAAETEPPGSESGTGGPATDPEPDISPDEPPAVTSTQPTAPEESNEESSTASDADRPAVPDGAEPEPTPTTSTDPEEPVARPSEPETDVSAPPRSNPDASTVDDPLPADCLIAAAADGSRYCYTAATRELMAMTPGGDTAWRFTLPGNDAVNAIRSIAFAQGRLVILATTRGDAGPGVELSTFGPSGAFVGTYPIEPGGHRVGVRLDPEAVEIHGTARALYLSGALIDDGSGAGGNLAVPDSVLARYDAADGSLEAWRGTIGDRARELDDPAGPDAPLAVVREGAPEGIDPWLLSPSTTPLVNADTWETHLLLARDWFEGDILSRALARIDQVLPTDIPLAFSVDNARVVDCLGGGTLEVTGFGNRISEQRHVYRGCRNAGALIDGVVVNTYGGSGGQGGVHSNTDTFRYEDFTVAFDDADDTRFEMDGTIQSSSVRESYFCITIGSSSTVNVERFSQTSNRGTMTVRSAEASRFFSERIGPAPGPADGPVCEPEIQLTEEARAVIAPPFAPDAALSIRFENTEGVEGGDARLEVRADDGSSVEVTGRLDGTRSDRVSWGGDGGRTDALVRGRFRPDLTALPGAR